MSKSTKFDKKYDNISLYAKLLMLLKYILRMQYWRISDLFHTKVSKTVSDYKLPSKAYTNWNENGFLHLEGVFPSSYIDEVVSSIAKSRKILEKDKYKMGHHSGRIANIHAINKVVFNFLMDPFLKDIHKQLLSGPSILWGSLSFEHGTEQAAHTDAPWFYVEPHGSMIGMWIALEDIKPESGPLFYIPQSHQDILKVDDILVNSPELENKVRLFREKNISASSRENWDLSTEVLDKYSSELGEDLKNITTVCPKKGDVIFWHQWLVHGGSKVIDKTLTRNSIVSHWVSEDSKSFSAHDFSLNYGKLNSKYEQKRSVMKSNYGSYLRQYRAQILNWN